MTVVLSGVPGTGSGGGYLSASYRLSLILSLDNVQGGEEREGLEKEFPTRADLLVWTKVQPRDLRKRAAS